MKQHGAFAHVCGFDAEHTGPLIVTKVWHAAAFIDPRVPNDGGSGQAIRWQVDQLCRTSGNPTAARKGQAERIRATLQQRRATFQALAGAEPRQVQEALGRDPLSALIALSRLAPSQPASAVPLCGALQRELAAQWAQVRPTGSP